MQCGVVQCGPGGGARPDARDVVMVMTAGDAQRPVQRLAVLPGTALRVHAGANLGDPVSFASELALDDVYRAAPGARPAALSLHAAAQGFAIAPGSAAGQPGAAVLLDSVLTFMSPDGATTEALLFVELDAAGCVAQSHVMALAPLRAGTDYALVTIDTEHTHARLAHVACVSFSRGTHITLASGAQVAIEALAPGDRVLTRDAGAQPIRWIGQCTLRATGPFAPIRIAAGALNNTADLLVSPDHRLFIYQRQDRIGAGRAEVLVKARHLVNGETITQRSGGYVEYFQLLFDAHQIIYAEGIAAESFLLDPRTAPALPGEVAGSAHAGSYGALDLREDLLGRPDLTDVLRRASRR